LIFLKEKPKDVLKAIRGKKMKEGIK